MSDQPDGSQDRVVLSLALGGLMTTEVIEGAVLPTVTEALVTAVPEAVPSVGVAVHASRSPLSNEAPVMLCVVTDGLPLIVHCQV